MKKFLSGVTSIVMLGIILFSNPIKAEAVNSYNYGEAMQKALMFYEFQMSGKMPDNMRTNWKGDSAVTDGIDVGLDLTGGWYDAGDHVKFNLPMAYTGTMLGWSYLESKDVYESTGQDIYMLQQLKWVNDYFIRCNPQQGTYCFQVGSGNADHAFWGPAEVMQMARPSYVASGSMGAAAACGEAASSLAIASVAFKDSDPVFAADCLKHSKWLFQQAEENPNDSYYNSVAGSFYKSWSGCQDELSWASVWLYKATGDDSYLVKAEKYSKGWGTEPQSPTIAYKWSQCWDDVHYGTCLLLADITGDDYYTSNIERHLDYWTTGVNGQSNDRIKYTPKGLAWLDTWGSLRYATTTAFLAAVYADTDVCSRSKIDTYNNFAKSQADYALGSSGRSYVCGFGENSPVNPHHRTAHAGWENNCGGAPVTNRHTLYGALVGGPNVSDGYKDDRTDYVANEVACDYNAGFTGLLAKMTETYGGTPIAGFDAVEEVGDECYLESCINAQNTTGDTNFVEFKTVVYNKTAWPARVTDKLSFKVFVNLEDVYNNGFTAKDMVVKSNYNQAGASISGLKPWDADNYIYYFDVDFTGKKLYPGGSEFYKKEIQYRVEAPCKWDFSDSYSVKGLTDNLIKNQNMPLYDDGKLIIGKEPGDPPPLPLNPVVSITSPANNSMFNDVSADNPIIIKANASVTDAEISKVEFYNGATKISTDTAAPYSCEFVPDALASYAGLTKSFDITAKAYSSKGTTAVSDKVTVKVSYPEIKQPEVTITSPVNETVFEKVDSENPIKLTADASVDGSSITKVEFYNGNKLIGTAYSKPYTINFVPAGFTVDPGNIEYFDITAKAYAANATSKVSDKITIGVKVPKLNSPVVSITEPDPDAIFENVSSANPIVIKADASVAGSTIKSVDFFVDSVRKANDTSVPYTYNFVPSFKDVQPGDIVSYNVVVMATAENGLSAVSNSITIKVKVPEAVLPQVSITSPINKTEYAEGTTQIPLTSNVSISDGSSIKDVLFYADGILFASDSTSPYTATFKDIGYGEKPGDYKDIVFTVKAVTSNGIENTSAPVTVRVYLKEKPVVNTDFTLTVENTKETNTNTITNRFRLTNNSNDSIDLSKLVIKYYYTADSNDQQQFHCDHSAIQHNVSPWYSDITGSVKSNITKLQNPNELADTCLEISFVGASSMILKTSVLSVDTRVNKLNWSYFNQANDYSYQSLDNICIYYNGELVLGNEIS